MNAEWTDLITKSRNKKQGKDNHNLKEEEK